MKNIFKIDKTENGNLLIYTNEKACFEYNRLEKIIYYHDTEISISFNEKDSIEIEKEILISLIDYKNEIEEFIYKIKNKM